jgi:HEAT repeat protein
MSGNVLTLVAGEPSECLTNAMAGLLTALPDEKKPALITALGARGNPAALAGITACLTSNNEPVRDAALMAAGKLGNEGTVKLLLGMGGTATGVIPGMPGGGVNAALIQALEDNQLKVPAIKAMIARNYLAAVPKLFDLLNDGDAEVRKAAWNGLGSLALDDDMPRMAKTAIAIQDERELSCAMAAVRKGCAYAGDKPKCFDGIIPYYDAATLASKATIIELASLVGTPSALELVKNALKSGDKELVGKAVRSLAAWCRENAADDLLVLAGSAPEEVERILALRGYIRLAGEGPNLNEEQRAEMFRKAAVLAKRVDEKKLIAGKLNKAPHAITLGLANTYLDDPAVREDAEPSAIDIAEHLRAHKKGSADVLKEVGNKLLSSKNGGVVARGTRLLDEIK